jgi:hypothetical protein
MEGTETNGLNALELQIGGSHYKRNAYQPIELITKLDCTFIQGCIIKYITRYRLKNGLQDINKCIHYAALAKELNNSKTINTTDIYIEVNKYTEQNNLTIIQRKVIIAALTNSYGDVVDLCNRLINIEYT